MKQQDKDENQAINQPGYPPFDDIQNLYIGPVEKAKGFLLTDQGTLPIFIWGEVLVYGQAKGETFVIERLRRVAFYGALEKPESDPRIGVFSLAGPLEEPALESGPSGATGIIEQLHYQALSSELEPLIKSNDAVFPQVEQIKAKLTWDQQGKLGERAALITISFAANELIEKKLGIIQRLTLDPTTINFFLAGTGAPSPEPHHSLQSNCPTPPAGPCLTYQQTFTRSLPLKFINFSTLLPSTTVETLCNIQIQGLCEVWRNKAALQFVIQDTLIEASSAHKSSYHILNPAEEHLDPGEVSGTTIETLGYDSTTQIEIYLIDQFNGDRHGGGIGYNFGQASAYCILDLGLLESDRLAHPPNGSLYLYVLAHEIGHVLGLAHPIGTPDFQTTGLIDSSSESIMRPANLPISPNPTTNTLYNCRVFLPSQTLSSPKAKTLDCVVLSPQPPYNPIVSSPETDTDCFRPDPVDHFIRDFPTDTHTEPSVPPSGQNFWGFSNVWNRRTNTPGALVSGAPDHEDPYICSDPTRNFINYMWVKLEQFTDLSDPVTVELYLADPGSSINLIKLNPTSPTGVENHRLNFCPPPIPASPVKQSLAWVVPSGYPSHSCVFAISFSDDDPSPIANPTSETFGTVTTLVLNHNGIVQRNLHIQETTCMNPRPCTTTLAWLQMENPFDKPTSAKLEIDTTKAGQLQELLLEVDDRIVGKITPGEILTIQIAELLQPGKSKILRFQATLPPVLLPHGTELPIHLRFIVGDQLINGYTHIVRVAPLETTILQVLDTLFGALRDVAVGFQSKSGQNLAERAKKIAIRERQKATSSGCFGLLWRIFRPKTAWRSQVIKLSKGIAALAQTLANSSEPESQVVRQHLFELAGLLLVPANTPAPIFIERIRELADRIQEPAGRLARQQLKI